MKLTIQHCCLTLTVVVFFSWNKLVSGEVKGPSAIKLCGQDFLMYYRHLCLNASRKRRSIPDTADITKPKDLPILQEKIAKQFLRRIRLPRSALMDNAKEECCKETCTSEEVREYPCN